MHLGTWYWDSKLCKWCCSRIYKREGTVLVAFTRVRLGFHSPQRSAKVSGKCAPQRPHWLHGRLHWEERDSDKEIPVDYNCREKWNQHSQQLHGPQDDSISAQRRPNVAIWFQRSDFLWMIIALFYTISLNRMTKKNNHSQSYRHHCVFPSCTVYLWSCCSGLASQWEHHLI